METNFNKEITNEQELLDFAELASSSHGLILRPSKSENSTIIIKHYQPRRFKTLFICYLKSLTTFMLKQICVPCTILADDCNSKRN
jgi:hypothetical protein